MTNEPTELEVLETEHLTLSEALADFIARWTSRKLWAVVAAVAILFYFIVNGYLDAALGIPMIMAALGVYMGIEGGPDIYERLRDR